MNKSRRAMLITVSLLLVVAVVMMLAGCSPFDTERPEYFVEVRETGLHAVEHAELVAYVQVTTGATFGSPLFPPEPAVKAADRVLSKLTVNRILLDGVPLDSLEYSRYGTERDSAFERGHEYRVDFDINKDVGDIESHAVFTLRDYSLHGLPEGDTISRTDTLRLWWEPADFAWPPTLLITSEPNGELFRQQSHDSSHVEFSGIPGDATELTIYFSRGVDEWYPVSETHDIYYHLEGEVTYQVTDPTE